MLPPEFPPESVVRNMPKGTRMKDFTAGWAAAQEEMSRMQDMIEIYTAHIEALDQTRKVYRGMLKKQGREIVSLRAKVKRVENFWQGASKTNSRLARSFNASSEILWKVAALPGRESHVISLKQAARSCIAERIRLERDE
jgi:hypothetical protein